MTQPLASPVDINCAICLAAIMPHPSCKEEEKKTLDCTHKFHRECIDIWLNRVSKCPLCQSPQTLSDGSHVAELASVRDRIIELRNIRQINLSEDSPLGIQARKVQAVVGKIFGW